MRIVKHLIINIYKYLYFISTWNLNLQWCTIAPPGSTFQANMANILANCPFSHPADREEHLALSWSHGCVSKQVQYSLLLTQFLVFTDF